MFCKSKSILGLIAAGVVTCVFSGAEANAIMITGNIQFAGGMTFNTNSLATATTVTGASSVFVTSVTGDFVTNVSPLDFSVPTFGSAVTMAHPWTFEPVLSPNPVVGLWHVTGNAGFSASFDLTSVSVSQSSAVLFLTGQGVIHATGYSDTAGTWVLSTQATGGPSSTVFSFSAASAALPDGGVTIALLGFAFIGIEGLRRKFCA